MKVNTVSNTLGWDSFGSRKSWATCQNLEKKRWSSKPGVLLDIVGCSSAIQPWPHLATSAAQRVNQEGPAPTAVERQLTFWQLSLPGGDSKSSWCKTPGSGKIWKTTVENIDVQIQMHWFTSNSWWCRGKKYVDLGHKPWNLQSSSTFLQRLCLWEVLVGRWWIDACFRRTTWKCWLDNLQRHQKFAEGEYDETCKNCSWNNYVALFQNNMVTCGLCTGSVSLEGETTLGTASRWFSVQRQRKHFDLDGTLSGQKMMIKHTKKSWRPGANTIQYTNTIKYSWCNYIDVYWLMFCFPANGLLPTSCLVWGTHRMNSSRSRMLFKRKVTP